MMTDIFDDIFDDRKQRCIKEYGRIMFFFKYLGRWAISFSDKYMWKLKQLDVFTLGYKLTILRHNYRKSCLTPPNERVQKFSSPQQRQSHYSFI